MYCSHSRPAYLADTHEHEDMIMQEKEKTLGELMAEVAFGPRAKAARCECYNGHNSSSGRCNVRNVTDPTHREGEPAICERCRRECVKL